MFSSEALSIILSFCALLSLTLVFLILQSKQVKRQEATIQNLLNRLMSGDLRTYQMMSQSKKIPSTNLSDSEERHSDLEEARRHVEQHGIGTLTFDENYGQQELEETLAELGIHELGMDNDRN